MLLFLFVIPVLSYGQSSVLTTTDVLKLKHKKYYRETDSFEISNIATFTQNICYDDTRSNDEEFCYTFLIYIHNAQFVPDQTFDIERDSVVIQCFYSCNSILNWSQGKTKISGTVKIISISSVEIKLQESIVVFDERKNKEILYEGIRTFYKTQNMN